MEMLSRLFPDRIAGRDRRCSPAPSWPARGRSTPPAPIIKPDRVSSPVEHTILVLLAGILILASPRTIALGRRAGTVLGARGAAVAVTGQVALAITCTASNINGGDPEWFIVAAPLANLLWGVAGSPSPWPCGAPAPSPAASPSACRSAGSPCSRSRASAAPCSPAATGSPSAR